MDASTAAGARHHALLLPRRERVHRNRLPLPLLRRVVEAKEAAPGLDERRVEGDVAVAARARHQHGPAQRLAAHPTSSRPLPLLGMHGEERGRRRTDVGGGAYLHPADEPAHLREARAAALLAERAVAPRVLPRCGRALGAARQRGDGRGAPRSLNAAPGTKKYARSTHRVRANPRPNAARRVREAQVAFAGVGNAAQPNATQPNAAQPNATHLMGSSTGTGTGASISDLREREGGGQNAAAGSCARARERGEGSRGRGVQGLPGAGGGSTELILARREWTPIKKSPNRVARASQSNSPDLAIRSRDLRACFARSASSR